MLADVLCQDLAESWVLERPQRLGAPRTLASSARWDALQPCHVPCQQGSPQTTLRAFQSERALLSRGRPLLHETLLLGSRNALRTTEHAETQKIAIWRPRPGDPLTASHFGPPDSIRRRVGRPTGRKAIYQAVRPLLHEALLLGSRNALRITEHAETQKIAIWRPRPRDPLTMSHFGPSDSIRRRVGRPLSRRGGWPRFSGPATRAGRPFTRLACNNAGWSYLRGSHSLKGAEEGPWPRKAF